MRWLKLLIAASLLTAFAFAGRSDDDAAAAVDVIEHVVRLKAKDYPQLTMFLRLPRERAPVKGVLCLCLLADSPAKVKEQLVAGKGGYYDYAEERQFAIVAWGSRRIWDPNKNWNELPRAQARQIDATFDLVSQGWDLGIDWFVKRHGIPESGFLMEGSCGAGQFVQRLALRKPKRFLAVHMNIPGSFDVPTKEGASVLWCLTTGERLDGGYGRSLAFFRRVRDMGYPIVYKAYPSVSHHQGTSKANLLGRACFDFALEEYVRAAERNGGKPAPPNWLLAFASAPWVADIKNQMVFPADDFSCVPREYRVRLPNALKDPWLAK